MSDFPPSPPSPAPVCHLCGQPATVFVTSVVQGNATQLAFCAQHAQQTGVLDQQAYAYGDTDNNSLPQRVQQAALCPLCGSTLATVQQCHRLGCSRCYQLFQSAVQPLVSRSQKGAQHLGKVPACRLSTAEMRQRIAFLERCLDQTVAQEQFEDAAQVRDALARYKTLLPQPPSPPVGEPPTA